MADLTKDLAIDKKKKNLSFCEKMNELIHSGYQKNNITRSRLGLSQIGAECPRVLYYAHNGFKQNEIDGRVLDLFDLGNHLETKMIKSLEDAGIGVFHEQEEIKIEHDGIELFGHIDGKCINVLKRRKKINLLELKTANEKSFNKLINAKSYEEWNPIYSIQIQTYMTLTELATCLVYVYCKNDSRKYFEIIKSNNHIAINAIERAFNIIKKKELPERLCPHAGFFKAKFCNFSEVCFG